MTGSANTFFCIFEKNYNDWIKSFSKSKWTGLKVNHFYETHKIPKLGISYEIMFGTLRTLKNE